MESITYIAAPPRRWPARLGRAFLLLSLLWLLLQGGLMLVVHFYGISQPPPTPAQALIVLGAGVNRDGRAGFALFRRAQLGATLYLDGRAPLILCTGGQPWDRPNAEANACRDVLLDLGVADAAILREGGSHSTEENALNSTPLLRAQGVTSVIVVSDSYHLLRAGFLFRAQGLQVQLIGVAPTGSRGAWNYLLSVTREALALQWQFVKDLLGLGFTRVPLL